ncbi:MAG: glycosyltransferase family A protein [Negativicutes bacterium]|nr:glycosyltransferase family A protein [Negativicutes bacterium]
MSIIVPAYNVSQYIEKTINSIQEQTYEDWEVIVINDGSSDNTSDVVKKLALLDERIILVNQNQAGVSAARNAGIRLAKGKVLTFLDGDDLWRPSFLSEILIIYNQGNDLVLCDFQHLYPNNIIKDHPSIKISDSILLATLNENLNFHIGALLVNKEIVDKYKIRFTIEHKISEDIEFVLKLLTVCKCSYLQKKLMLYRKQRPGSATEKGWDYHTRISSVWAMKKVYQFIEQNYTDPNKEYILNTCNNKIRLSMFRYLWKLIRHGYYKNTIELLKNENWDKEISLINRKNLNNADKLRHTIILNENLILWKIISLFKKP